MKLRAEAGTILGGHPARGIPRPPLMSRLAELHLEDLVLWAFWMAVLVVLVASGAYLVGKLRSKALQQEPTVAELLIKFRELHSQGVLSDAEFRTIKTTLTAQLQRELKDNGEKG